MLTLIDLGERCACIDHGFNGLTTTRPRLALSSLVTKPIWTSSAHILTSESAMDTLLSSGMQNEAKEAP